MNAHSLPGRLWAFSLQKLRRICAAHGANKVKILFSGGKWVKRQERKRSEIGEIAPMQCIPQGKYFSPCKLGETPNTQALRSVFGQVEPIQRCGISARSRGESFQT